MILIGLKWILFVDNGKVLIFLDDCHVDLKTLYVFNHLFTEYFGGSLKFALESNLRQLGFHLLFCYIFLFKLI